MSTLLRRPVLLIFCCLPLLARVHANETPAGPPRDARPNGRFIAIDDLRDWATAVFGQARDRDAAVRNDRKQFQDDETWIYNDLTAGFAQSKTTGKPMLVVFR